MVSKCRGFSLVETLAALLILSLSAALLGRVLLFRLAWHQHADWQLQSAKVASKIAEHHDLQSKMDLEAWQNELNVKFRGSKIEEVCSQTQCEYMIIPPQITKFGRLAFILRH